MSERPSGNQKNKPTRRTFLQGVGAVFSGIDRGMNVVGGASLGATAAIIETKAHERRKAERKFLASREGGFRVSKRFADHVRVHEKTFERIHMSGIEKYGEKEAIGAEGRTRIGEVRERFMNKQVTGLPAPLREELAFLGPGLPAKESSYNNSSDSGIAVRIFQFRPEVYQELGFSDEDMKLLKNQVICANMFFVKEYKSLSSDMAPALARIEQRYFPGNKERFERQFLPLVMLSVYHAGPRRVREALAWFSKQPPDTSEGYDVYEAMSSRLKELNENTEGDENDPVPGYKEHSSNYAQKVFAFARLIEKAVQSGKIQLTTQ